MGRWKFSSVDHSKCMEIETSFFNLSENEVANSTYDTDFQNFSDYPFPLCILNNFFDTISYNNYFKKINITPLECQSLKDLDKIEKMGNIYLVRIKKIEYMNEDFFLFVFQGLDSFKDSLSKKEKEIFFKNENNDLEIVTSSMAHELNNPIAGILGAIELLECELDCETKEDFIVQDLLEIKKSAKRCKDLIEIFLGFSRSDFNCKKSDSRKNIYSTLTHSSDKALDLLRPRMLESNININLILENELLSCEEGIPVAQMGTFTLLIYSLLNEALVYLSHQRLVLEIPIETRQVFEWKLNLQQKNEGEELLIVINLTYDSSRETFKRLCDSKLFQYLLKKINLNLLLHSDAHLKGRNNLTFYMKKLEI